MNRLTTNQIKTILGATGAVCAFLIAQPDVVLNPAVKVALGAVIVFLAVVNPQGAKSE